MLLSNKQIEGLKLISKYFKYNTVTAKESGVQINTLRALYKFSFIEVHADIFTDFKYSRFSITIHGKAYLKELKQHEDEIENLGHEIEDLKHEIKTLT